MTEIEFRNWYNRASLLFDEVKRFVESRSDQAGELLGEWHAVLSDVGYVDCNSVLDMLLSGEIKRPDFFDVGRFAGLVMREARSLAGQRRSRRHFASEERFRCHVCRETGLVNVWNPHFVEAYRDKFGEVTREPIDRDEAKAKAKENPYRVFFDLDERDPEREIVCYRYQPANWQAEAARWWRGTGDDAGPLHHLVRCTCDCTRSETLLRERELFTNRERKLRGNYLGAPGCGMADYNPRIMARKTMDAYQDLLDWYAAHEVNAAYSWQPNPADYASRYT